MQSGEKHRQHEYYIKLLFFLWELVIVVIFTLMLVDVELN